MTDINAAGQNVVTAINNLNLKFQGAAFLKGYNMVLDRSHLNTSTIANSITRIYCRYYNSTNNAYSPDAPTPHVSGHWMRRRTISASGTNAQRLALTWGDAQTGQYFLQTDTTPNLVWWWLSDSINSNNGSEWLQAGHIGYAWDTSDSGTAYWQVDELEPNAIQMGALNSPGLVISATIRDDTIPLTDLAYYYQMNRNCFVPCGYYNVTTAIPLATQGENIWRGEGGTNSNRATIITSTAAINVIEINDWLGSGIGFKGNLRDFGAGAFGTTGDGIHSNIPSSAHNPIRECEWKGVTAWGTNGMYIPGAYSFTLSNCQAGGYGGHGFVLPGAVGTVFIQCRAGAAKNNACFRVGNHCTFVACNCDFSDNGVGSNDSWGYLLGSYASFSGTATAGSTNTITLAGGTTSVTDQITGLNIVLTGGTGSGQTRTCTAFSSSTKVATVNSTWTTNPDATTTYTIQDPIAFLQSAPPSNGTAVFTMIGCNTESYVKDGVRTYGDTKLTIDGITTGGNGASGNYEGSIRIAPNQGNSQIAITNLFAINSSLRTAGADIVSEGVLQWYPGYGGTYFNVTTGNVETYGVGVSSSVGGLPAAASVTAGSRSFVTDSNATTFHNTVASGGANKVPVVSDGTNWLIG